MAFPQAKQILEAQLSPLATYKLLAMAAARSRPRCRKVCLALLRPFEHSGEVAIRYPCYGRNYVVNVRIADLESDWLSVHELAIRKIYPIEDRFAPDLIIDGGGNTGLFTLLASAAFPTAKVVTCEPVRRMSIRSRSICGTIGLRRRSGRSALEERLIRFRFTSAKQTREASIPPCHTIRESKWMWSRSRPWCRGEMRVVS